jgi:HlyD family secretion protein
MDRRLEKRRWTPRRTAYAVGFILLVMMAVYAWSLIDGGSRLNVNAERTAVSVVERGDFQEFVSVTGTVVPISTYFLDAVEGGRVDTVYVEAGNMVRLGDEILRLSNTNLLLDIMYREAELFHQSNNLRNTTLAMASRRLELRREILDLSHEIKKQTRVTEDNAELAGRDLISEREYEEALEELRYLRERYELALQTQRQDSLYRAVQIEQLEASLERMQENLGLVRLNLKNLVIKAPVSGHLTSLNAEVGESKARGERLGRIDILDGFKVLASIDEHYVARVGVGQRGSFNLSGETYGLTVVKVYPEVVDARFEVDMAFDGREPGGIRRGQTLRIRLELGDPSEAVLLPTGGFYQTTGGRWVYVVSESGDVARKRRIQLGRANALYYEVLGGLEPGERVITSSYESFGDADRLVLK